MRTASSVRLRLRLSTFLLIAAVCVQAFITLPRTRTQHRSEHYVSLPISALTLNSSSSASTSASSASASTSPSIRVEKQEESSVSTVRKSGATAAPPPPTQLRFRDTTLSLVQASLVGIATALSVVAFKTAIKTVKMTSRSIPLPLTPAIGGLIVSGMLPFFSNPTTESSTRRSILQSGIMKTLASAVTLGTGNSLGPEGPCVEIGTNVSKLFRHPTLLACGAAAGVAAGFNAPITGVFFALEILKPSSAIDIVSVAPILVSSMTAASVGRLFLGDHLMYLLSSQFQIAYLPAYVLLGAVSGAISWTFTKTLQRTHSAWDKGSPPRQVSVLKRHSGSFRPAVAGLLCGLVALKFPQVMRFGHELFDPLLSNTMLPTTKLLGLLLAKTLTTSVCAASGLVGGTFLPSLFLGATSSAILFNFISGLLPVSSLAAFSMVGAASTLASVFRAPLTSTLLMFEVSRDYNIVFPVMLSAGIASMVRDVLDSKRRFAKQQTQSK